MLALPWFGEFGHEVALWAPHLRYLAKTEGLYVDAHCQRGHRYLYEDFARSVTEVSTPPNLRVDCQNAWSNGTLLREPVLLAMTGKKAKKGDVIGFDSMHVQWDPVPRTKRVLYELLGAPLLPYEGMPSVLVHVRHCPRKQPERNWSLEDANAFVAAMRELGHDVGAVGCTGLAVCPVGATNFIGATLRHLCDLMHTATVIVGPSSGPLALALQSACSVAWWSPNEKDGPRFERVWNPFSTRQRRVAMSWAPQRHEVLESVLSLLQPSSDEITQVHSGQIRDQR